jgi:molecular chaperone DnaK (HSP70)
MRILNEPTAALLCYVHNTPSMKGKMVLIVDIGGGTSDITILQCGPDGVNTVKSTVGNEFNLSISVDIHVDSMIPLCTECIFVHR